MDSTQTYEDRLGDALEKLLGDGANDLDALCLGLNTLGIVSPAGKPWNTDSLAAEFRRLGK
jgi:hypothetical protein